MGGTGKSQVITAFYDYAETVSNFCGWEFDEHTIVITALTGSAATELENGCTFHSAVKISQAIKDDHRIMWKNTKMIIIDEVSFLTTSLLIKGDRQMRLLKEIKTLFGNCHVVFSGDFHQLLPIGGKALFEEDTVQFGAINKAIFLNISWRCKDDEAFGEVMRRFRNGTITKDDIALINSRYIDNPDVKLPPQDEMQYACAKNSERNAISSNIFLDHLKRTHPKSDDNTSPCPSHTVIIKAAMTYGSKKGRKVRMSTQNKIYDQCGDSDVINENDGSKVDPALKFYHGVPLMIVSNNRIIEKISNGTCCFGMYVVLKNTVLSKLSVGKDIMST